MYCDFSCQTPWQLKISRIKALHGHASKICSSNKLPTIYSICMRNSIIKHLHHNKTAIQNDDERVINILIQLPYLGNKGKGLLKKCISKLKHCFKTNVNLFTLFDTKRCTRFCSANDKILNHQKSIIVYTRKCPRCGKDCQKNRQMCNNKAKSGVFAT